MSLTLNTSSCFFVNNLKTKITHTEKRNFEKKWKIGDKHVTMKRHIQDVQRAIHLWFLHLTTVSTRYSPRFTSVVIKIHRIFSRVWIMNTNVLIIPVSRIPKKKKKGIVSHHDHDKSVYHTNAFKVSCNF